MNPHNIYTNKMYTKTDSDLLNPNQQSPLLPPHTISKHDNYNDKFEWL